MGSLHYSIRPCGRLPRSRALHRPRRRRALCYNGRVAQRRQQELDMTVTTARPTLTPRSLGAGRLPPGGPEVTLRPLWFPATVPAAERFAGASETIA